MIIRFAATLVFIALSTPSFALEAEAGAEVKPPPLTKEQIIHLVEDGQKLASERCASCHSITLEGDSINTEAPPFRDFASKWPLETLEESLAEGIVTGHEEMPEFVFTPQEITAFLEYLRTLQKKQDR